MRNHIDRRYPYFVFFFFNDTATTEIYTLSLHDALPISLVSAQAQFGRTEQERWAGRATAPRSRARMAQRSEEHTSELQSPDHLVCRLLLEKKKKTEQAGATRRAEYYMADWPTTRN